VAVLALPGWLAVITLPMLLTPTSRERASPSLPQHAERIRHRPIRDDKSVLEATDGDAIETDATAIARR
jgi:hypothetical protein